MWDKCAVRLIGYGTEEVMGRSLVEEFITDDIKNLGLIALFGLFVSAGPRCCAIGLFFYLLRSLTLSISRTNQKCVHHLEP